VQQLSDAGVPPEQLEGLWRHQEPAEVLTLLVVLGLAVAAAGWLVRDFVAHPANFPAPAPSHGMRMAAAIRTDAKTLSKRD
jgi:hypothetical protein